MSERKPPLGTLAHYQRELDALEAARAAVEATGADLDLVAELVHRAQMETMARMACDFAHDDAASNEFLRREQARRDARRQRDSI
jgi:hypothetical protein